MLNFRTNLQLDGSLGLIVKLIKNFFDVSFDMKYWMTYIVGPTSYYINVLKESNCIWHFFYLMLAALLVHNGCVLVLTNYRIISSKVLSLWIFPVVFWFGHKSKYFFTHGVWVCWFSLKIIKAHRSHNDDRVWPQRCVKQTKELFPHVWNSRISICSVSPKYVKIPLGLKLFEILFNSHLISEISNSKQYRLLRLI